MKHSKINKRHFVGGMTDAEILRHRTELLATGSRDESGEAQTGEPVMVFRVGQETYGAELPFIWEVINFPQVTPAPGTPRILRGVINYRGEIIPLYDLFSLLAGKNQETPSSGACIVFGKNSVEFAVAVDKIEPPARVDMVGLNDSMNRSGNFSHSFIHGITDTGCVILNVAAMFNDSALKINVQGKTGK